MSEAMDKFDLFVIARALHILGVVVWIGGVSFVTLVLIPAIKRVESNQGKMQLFEHLEGRFAFQAKIATLVTVFSGVYMLEYLHCWDRYLHLQFWWMHLMTFVWFVFSMVLFVLEPLFLHEWFRKHATKDVDGTFRLVHRMHIILLSLSVIAIVGAMAGSHGLSF